MRPFSFFSRLFTYRGTSVITCPETHQPAAVKVDSLHAALADDLRLNACSRWPEKAGCDQACLSQIAAHPDACRLHSIVAAWYAGKACVFCRRPVGKIVWHERPPALLAPDGVTREWSEVAAEELPVLFRTHQPVCWACHIVASFRRENPNVVIERPRPETQIDRISYTTNVY